MVRDFFSAALKSGLLVWLVVGCMPKADFTLDKPKDVIPEDTMIRVIKELMVLENHFQTTYPGSFASEGIRKTGDTLLQRYNLTFERFDRSFKYYASDQDRLGHLYTAVQDSLKKELIQLQNH